ncbi:Uncharacterized protein FWK35_00015436, partial [Aphis craccivora]
MSTSSSATKTALRGYNNIYLIGSVQNQIIGSKLPSNRQKLDDLFDISHANVLNMIQNEEDKKLLLLQRQKGPGCMLGTDYKLAVKEKKIIRKLKNIEQQKKREHSETDALCIEAIGHDISKLKINRSTLQRKRAMFHETKAKELKINFNVLKLDYVVLHWDGKLLPDLCEK